MSVCVRERERVGERERLYVCQCVHTVCVGGGGGAMCARGGACVRACFRQCVWVGVCARLILKKEELYL